MLTKPDNFRFNFLQDHKWTFGRGRRRRSPPNSSEPSPTDSQTSPKEEEPQKVIVRIDQMLEAKHFYEVGLRLNQKEEGLFGDVREAEALAHHDEEVNKLAADYRALEEHVLETLKLSLSLGQVSLEALTSAVRAMKQQEDQDKLWSQRDHTPPAWRPSGWGKLHDSTLRSLVEEQMDTDPQTPPVDQVDQSTIQADLHSMGRRLKEDLQSVVNVLKNCYPPELDICNFYASLYHETLSARLRKIADFGLDDKDCTFLLRWVNEYYPQILQNPELASEINVESLGKLLPKESLDPLEHQYLDKQQSELTRYVGAILEEAEQDWNKGEEPKREDGCFVSTVAYDIIQFINGMVTSAERVVGDLHKAQKITVQLKDLMQRFKIFQNNIIKKNTPNSQPLIKANLGCIEQFMDFFEKKSHLFTEDVQKHCLDVLIDMKESAHTYLLKPVHNGLKPQYRKLGTSDWLNKPLFEKLLVSLEKELQDLQGSTESCHQKLIGQLHQEVTAEYVKRLLKGQIKLKDMRQQLKAYETVKDDAESLHDLFVKMGSREDWLKEILNKIAEVLKLQDLPALQMHVVSLGTSYPDLSEKHVAALLKLKTNLTKDNRRIVKDTLSDTLRETSGDADSRPFFSGVQVK
ncbi:tumor necrosis factor alpha-induced protein 2-like isoform X2 [Plectropomus leopardus]|nr:tumor necrosis factor alpha-induced protein 2-like isoform X2 [Plectropomus leopardus]XP_042357204.1 tumor necrosis factor alpha-induced protein 2-like isoform X2 [Plectropomus leopardus]